MPVSRNYQRLGTMTNPHVTKPTVNRFAEPTLTPSGIVSLQSKAIKFRNSNFVIKEVNYMVKASQGPGIRLRNKRHFVISISL